MSEKQATTDAREASMSRVTTQDEVLAKAIGTPPKEEPPQEEAKPADGQKPKRSINERITQLVEQRRAAESKAEAAERERDELRARLEASQVKAEPLEPGDRPQRASFTSQEEYEDALTDWKADQRIAKREQEQAAAQAKAEFDAMEGAWTKRCETVKTEVEDFEEVVGASEIQISDAMVIALKRSEHGPQLLYFFAKHPDEAKKVSRMHPFDMVRHIDSLAKDLMSDEPETKPEPVKRSKAPEPITPVKNAPALAPGPASSFEEHRARRMAEKRSKLN